MNPHNEHHSPETIAAIDLWDDTEGHVNSAEESAAAAEAHEQAIIDHLKEDDLRGATEHLMDLSMITGSTHRLVYEQPGWDAPQEAHFFDRIASAWSRGHVLVVEWIG